MRMTNNKNTDAVKATRAGVCPVRFRVRFWAVFLAAFLAFGLSSCGDSSSGRSRYAETKSVIPLVENEKHFAEIIESSGEQLLMFDLYADWCAPCKELSPVLEEIARENSQRVTAYKINVDDNRAVASSFRMTGIPFVVFVKNKTVLHSFVGVYPKKTYIKAVEAFSKPS